MLSPATTLSLAVSLYAKGLNYFFGNNYTVNRHRLGRILHGDIGSGCTLPCKLLALCAKRAQNSGEKTHFANFFFLSPKQRIVSPTSRRQIFVKFERKA